MRITVDVSAKAKEDGGKYFMVVDVSDEEKQS